MTEAQPVVSYLLRLANFILFYMGNRTKDQQI